MNACLDYLRLRGCFCWRVNQGAMTVTSDKGVRRFIRFSHQKGISDIVGMTADGKFIAVECKIAPNKPTDDQRTFLQDVYAHDGIAIVAYEVEHLEPAFSPCVKLSGF